MPCARSTPARSVRLLLASTGLVMLPAAAIGQSAPDEGPARPAVRLQLQRRETLRYPTHVRIESNPPGAEVIIDGQRFGRTPLVLDGSLRPGMHRLVLTLEDYLTHEETIRVGRAGKHRVELRPDVPVERVEQLPVVIRRTNAPGAAPAGPPKLSGVDPAKEAVTGGVPVFDSSWQIGFLVGSGPSTVSTAPGTRYFSIRTLIQRNLMEQLGVWLGFEFALAPDLDPISNDPTETGAMTGFALEAGLPFYVDRFGAHGVALGLSAGMISHGYRYQAVTGTGGVEDSAAIRLIQARVGGFAFYEYLPDDEHGGADTGLRIQATYWAHGPPAPALSDGKPDRALAVDAGLVVRF